MLTLILTKVLPPILTGIIVYIFKHWQSKYKDYAIDLLIRGIEYGHEIEDDLDKEGKGLLPERVEEISMKTIQSIKRKIAKQATYKEAKIINKALDENKFLNKGYIYKKGEAK